MKFATAAVATFVCIGCAGRPSATTSDAARHLQRVDAEKPELILVRCLNAQQMQPKMLLSPTVAKFFGTSNDLSVQFPRGRGELLMRTFAGLQLHETQDFPDYNNGLCYLVEVFYSDKIVKGFLFHRGDSALRRWFRTFMPGKLRYML